MKLTPESVKQLETLLQSVSLVKIDSLIIEPGKIRGVDAEKSVVIMYEGANIPDFGSLTIGLNRVSTLINRINLAKLNKDFSAEAVESERNKDEVSVLRLTADKTKIEFRCANINSVKCPKSLNDTPKWLIVVPKDSVPNIISAGASMGADQQIIITSKPGVETTFEFIDSITQDTFVTSIGASAIPHPSVAEAANESFVHYYAVKSFMPLLKAGAAAGDVELAIGENGMMQVDVNGYTFTVLPRIPN